MDVSEDAVPPVGLRDWFAGMALSAYIQASLASESEEETAAKCYAYADAMLRERSKEVGS